MGKKLIGTFTLTVAYYFNINQNILSLITLTVYKILGFFNLPSAASTNQ